MDSVRLDRSAFSVGSLSDAPDEKAYWRTKTPEERLEALELMRRIIYGYNPATVRLQRILEIAELLRSPDLRDDVETARACTTIHYFFCAPRRFHGANSE